MIKPIAIYLPQYHPIPVNDKAWGDGFTEWTNVKKAEPLFEGHYQPHIPHESVGYYDLLDPEVLVRQAAMAKEYGIYGFSYYHYWFNGNRYLEAPLDNMLKLKVPDFPFCYIWANENWTKRWDGQDSEIIIKQEYSFEDDVAHIKFLCENVFSDSRYIRIDDKPVFIIYRTEILPDAKKTAQIWQDEVQKYGFKGIYLVRVENFESGIHPKTIGYDAALEFGPDWRSIDSSVEKVYDETQLYYQKINYNEVVANMIAKKCDYKLFRCVFPSWDNSSRKKYNIGIFTNTSTPVFTFFLQKQISHTMLNLSKTEQFLFINAWNEWGEGCHIEPDKSNGYSFLESIKYAISNKEIIIPEEYYNFIEEKRLDLKSENTRILEESNKYKKAYKSIDYTVGKIIIFPFRFFRRIIYSILSK